jgi:hypothetical protein
MPVKTWRIASLIVYSVSFVLVAFMLTTPLRYPDFMFVWQPVAIFLTPLLVIVGLLALRQRWQHHRFSAALLAAALIFIALTTLGYMAWPILAVAFLALLGMFIASRALPNAMNEA